MSWKGWTRIWLKNGKVFLKECVSMIPFKKTQKSKLFIKISATGMNLLILDKVKSLKFPLLLKIPNLFHHALLKKETKKKAFKV